MCLKENQTCLLHGTLDAMIYETRRLRFGVTGSDLQAMGLEITAPRTKTRSITRRLTSHLKRLVLNQPQIVDLSIYATVDLDKARVGRTKRVKIQSRNKNPKWEQQFHIYCAHEASHITFTIKDDKPVGAILIGRAHLPVQDVLQTNNCIFDGWINIVDEGFVPIRGNPQIRVRLQFKDVMQDVNWSRGIANPSYKGVPNTPFPQRQGCRVTLYQDAHVGREFNPNWYQPQRCWEDIYEAIVNAKHFVYVSGWSVNPKTTLKREVGKDGYNVEIGDLLKRKADEGLKVLVLVWDDRTSIQLGKEVKRDGLMDTHDEETAEFFADTNVHCVLCPRVPDKDQSMVQEVTGSTMFTHHQKMVIVDAKTEGFNGRTIVSFIGGIDLCGGRYDTQDHPLFKTLNTIHNQDFHQPNFEGASINKGGPREPWHDVHCRLEGSIAWDVLYNFEDRWTKQVGDRFIILHDKFREMPIVESPVNPNSNTWNWNVQLFRSIDEGSVDFKFPPNIKEDPIGHGLITGKDCIIDRSIQDAYIHAIRRAKSFIYIENQYFIGSSFGWKSNDIVDADIGALHLIPKELSLKIVRKIEAGERFAVYVVIPMWPEGIPESESVQAILDWQRRTMEMMYRDIAEAIKKKGLTANPRDYLTFFCLGNREWKDSSEHVPTETLEPDTDYYRAQQERRFMIYVHSKMMIVDDEYIIIGSANINQRSMDGARDTEIAMGAFQPNHLSSHGTSSRGNIHGFRMSLWYEHLGYVEANFANPERLECIKKVNERADTNWKLYTKSRNTGGGECPKHLLRYPIEVNIDGTLTAVHGLEHFPDTKARVLGKKAARLPPILTT